MRFFDEALSFKLPRNPITGALQGAMVAGIVSVYYDLATLSDTSPEKSAFIVNTWFCLVSIGWAIGATRQNYEHFQAAGRRL